jgi:hypothetical protein
MPFCPPQIIANMVFPVIAYEFRISQNPKPVLPIKNIIRIEP